MKFIVIIFTLICLSACESYEYTCAKYEHIYENITYKEIYQQDTNGIYVQEPDGTWHKDTIK